MGDGYPLVVAAALVGLAGNVVAHVLAAQLTAGRRVALALSAGGGAGLVVTGALTAVGLERMTPAWDDAVALAALNLATYLALAFGYFNFVNLSLASLRIRVLLELLGSRAGLTRGELLRLYNAHELMSRRIDRLTGHGYLVERNEYFQVQGRGLVVLASIITGLKWLVLGHGNRALQQALQREAKRGRS
jgi:hypothetical protein